MAITLGYDGQDFKGNQFNREQDSCTVEGVVFNALYKIGAISPLNYLSREPKKLKWCRSSRTDKGVHATAIIVSLNALFLRQMRNLTQKRGTVVAS